MDEPQVRAFFDRYANVFERGLSGAAGMEEAAALYAPAFVAASPAGVHAGTNDASLQQVMAQGYERYRAMGTKAMHVRDVRLTPIDDLHGVAHVAWTATYARGDGADVAIDFEVHYLLQERDGELKVFGWVSGDEEAALREHGLV
jgi:hypothetical protein